MSGKVRRVADDVALEPSTGIPHESGYQIVAFETVISDIAAPTPIMLTPLVSPVENRGTMVIFEYEYACASRLWTRSKRAFVRLAAEDGIGPLVAELLAPIVKA